MKHKIISITCIFAAICFATLAVSGAKKQVLPEYDGSKAVVTKCSDETTYLGTLSVAAEDSKAILYYDSDTANIAIKNKADDTVLFSAPVTKSEYGSLTAAQQQVVLSPVILSYTDSNLKSYSLYSFKDSAAYGQIKHKLTKNGVTFTMTLGKLASSEIVAEVLTEDSAKKLEKVLSEKDYRYLIQSYKKTMLKGNYADKALLKDYPILKNEEFFYSIKTGISVSVKNKLSSIFRSANFTKEQLDSDEKLIYGKVKSLAEETPNFTFDLEYTLDKGELVTNISVDKIDYDESKYKLIELEVLRYFGADGFNDNGFFLLPDGSGTVAEYSSGVKGNGSPITINLYGQDSAYRYNSANEFVKNGVVPVYGHNSGNKSYIATVEKGDAQCSVNAVIDESGTGFRFADFVCKTRLSEKYVHSERASRDEFIRSTVNCYDGDFRVRYIPVIDDNYSAMANTYRKYLDNNGYIKNNKPTSNGLQIELLGAVDSNYSGFISDSKVFALTKFNDAKKILDEFDGIADLSVKYSGFANGGLNHTVFSKVKVMNELGGKKELKKLLSSSKASFYVAIDNSYIYQDNSFDGFGASNDATHRLDNSYAHIYPFNLGSSLANYNRSLYSVKSSSMLKYNDKLLKELDFGVKGIYYENIGKVLNSDSSKKSGSRSDAMNDYASILKSASKKYNLELNGGNLYTYKYANAIREIENKDSGFRNTSYSVPFVQMILHGKIPYSSYALNCTEDYKFSFLKAIENGEQLSYTLAYRNLDKLTNSLHNEYNSVNYSYWKNIIKNDVKKADDLLKGTYDKTITEHKYLKPDVVSVVYENGVNIIVNYSYADYSVNGIEVNARDAIRIEN